MMYSIRSFSYNPQVDLLYSEEEIRRKMFEFQDILSEQPTARFNDECGTLRHTFVDGAYIREITMERGDFVVSKIHKKKHPFFVMQGECSVLTGKTVERIKAPCWGVTEPGTKRILYIHEKTIWTTVHVTNSTDLKEIEGKIIAPSFENIITHNKEDLLCLGD